MVRSQYSRTHRVYCPGQGRGSRVRGGCDPLLPTAGSMDVVCERCQTEYEFDDALVSERGTTVKCTNCGHQFKIYRPPSSEANAESRSWSLKRADGTTSTFDSLAVLQKWIIEGRVTRADQISRAGEAWKPLGSIAELDSFF